MENEPITKIRRIGKIDAETPLLLPSFSSVFDRKIRQVHTTLTDHIPDCSLISAYDLAYGYITKEDIWASNLVYIDSGNYEYQNLEICKDRKKWSPQLHEDLLNLIRPLSKLVIVNFDKVGSIHEQIKTASNLFEKFPKYASCFLCKPLSKSSKYVDVPKIIENIGQIENFEIIAFTEKELGSSLIKKCENIVKIRQALTSKELNKPIHIFGCLDPLAIITYFLCGADIFDGTNWLKYTFYDNVAIYNNNYSILYGSWSDSDITIRKSSYVFNLSKLTRLTQDMRRYTRDVSLDSFNLTEQIQRQISDLVNTAQVKKR